MREHPMFKAIRRRLCSHSFSWSERRHGDLCVKCGLFRPEQAGFRETGEEHPV
jgi:hypothetical protein